MEFAYDAAGNVLAETRRERSDLGGAEQVFVRVSGYDRLHRLTRSADNVGNTNRWIFNSLDQCVKEIDPRGFATFHQYDLLGRRTQTVGDLDGDGVASLSQDYSERATWSTSNPSRQLSTSDSHGNETSYEYDSLDRLTNTVYADGTRTKLVWSPKSNLSRVTDQNGSDVLLIYDQNSRCISKTIVPGSGVATNTMHESFEYDGLSRLTRAGNEQCDDRFVYDSLGDCVSESINGVATVSTYDSLGHRTAITYPGGRSLTCARNTLGRCGSISESGLALAVFEYDGPDRLARASYLNNIRTRIFYDGLYGTTNAPGDFGWGRVHGVRHAVSGAQPVIHDSTYAWDRDGNKTARVEIIPPPAIPRTNSLTLRYDPQSRMTNALLVSNSSLIRDTIYGFDHVGNRTNVSGSTTCSGAYVMDDVVPGPQDFQMNQYTATPCDARQYDDNGNLIFVGAGPISARIYTYDYAGRLVSILDSGSLLATYSYDPLGRCISKTTYPGGLPAVTNRYVYDRNNVIEERNGTNIIASYMYLDGSRSQDDGVIESFLWQQVRGPFSMRRNGADYYLHTDDQGSVVAVTDTNGACVERYTYDDYGTVTFLTSDGLSNSVAASIIGNPYLYQGMRFEAESGLHRLDDRKLLGLKTYNPAKNYLIGDTVIYGNSLYEASVGRTLDCDDVGDNNPWSNARSKQSEAKSNSKAMFTVGRSSALGGGGGGSGGCGGLSSKRTRADLYEEFKNGDIPNQDDFADLIDSMANFRDDRYLLRSGIPIHAGKVPRNVLKEYFEKGDKPTQAQFGSLIDSMVHMPEDRMYFGSEGSRVQFARSRHEFTGHVTLIK